MGRGEKREGPKRQILIFHTTVSLQWWWLYCIFTSIFATTLISMVVIKLCEGKQPKQLMHYDLGTLVLCQIYFFLSFMVAKTASEVQTKGWDEMTETMFFWDGNYLIAFIRGQVLAFVCLRFSLLFFSNLPCNMLKNYRFLCNTLACCLPFLRAKKASPYTTLSYACRA